MDFDSDEVEISEGQVTPKISCTIVKSPKTSLEISKISKKSWRSKKTSLNVRNPKEHPANPFENSKNTKICSQNDTKSQKLFRKFF